MKIDFIILFRKIKKVHFQLIYQKNYSKKKNF